MKREVAIQWVKDLREYQNPNGGSPQCKGALTDGNGAFCCLGRLSMILGGVLGNRTAHADGSVSVPIGFRDPESGKIDYGVELLSKAAAEAAGMSYKAGILNGESNAIRINGNQYYSLAEANDGGESFLAIADFIEKNWERL